MKPALKIAIADDERDVREFLQEALPRLGHEVVGAVGTGSQLSDLCRTKRPDLIITDIKMPEGDGMEAASIVNREQPIPVILISAHHDAGLLNRLNGQYIMGYLVKPVGEADLKTAIALAMVRFQHFKALAQEAADLRQALEDRKVIERAKGILMKRLRVDEEDAFRRLRKYSSDQNRKLVETGRSVVAAEEIFHDLDRS